MTLPRPAPAPIGTIVTATAAYLADQTGLDPSRVFITVMTPDDTPRFGAAQDILLRPMSEEPDVGIIDGAERFDNRRIRSIEVSIRTRLFLDQAGQDSARLTDVSLGHFQMEDKVVDALEFYYPSDGDTNNALSLPFRVGRLTAPQRLRDDANWLFSTFTVAVQYMRDLDATKFLTD